MKIAVMDLKPGVGVSEATVNGISEMLISSLFDRGKFSIIERTQLDKAIKEQGFQKSNVSAEQVAKVGQILGVKYILTGIVNFIITERTIEDVVTSMAKGEYSIDVRIVNVESGEVVSAAGVGVSGSQTVRSVMPELAKELAEKIEVAQVGKIYKIGDFGPAGGIIFHDKGIFSNGWRYLEAAPLETEFIAEWGLDNITVEGTRSEVGFGKANTQIILTYLTESDETGKAAQLCATLNFDGHKDWFLPSRGELFLIFTTIRTKGDFSGSYWTSTWVSNRYSAYAAYTAYTVEYHIEAKVQTEVTGTKRKVKVRAIRAF